MREQIIENMRARFEAYEDLITYLDDAALEVRIDAPRHKSLKEHFWCVVGARESYAAAIEAGKWQGFNCSMTSYSTGDFKTSLKASAKAVMNAVDTVPAWTEARDNFVATLHEHEVMHEGQVIRHVYGTNGTLPPSWKWA